MKVWMMQCNGRMNRWVNCLVLVPFIGALLIS